MAENIVVFSQTLVFIYCLQFKCLPYLSITIMNINLYFLSWYLFQNSKDYLSYDPLYVEVDSHVTTACWVIAHV